MKPLDNIPATHTNHGYLIADLEDLPRPRMTTRRLDGIIWYVEKHDGKGGIEVLYEGVCSECSKMALDIEFDASIRRKRTGTR